MTTVREARLQAAREAIDWVGNELGETLSTPVLEATVNAVIDALFPPDPLIDNAEITV